MKRWFELVKLIDVLLSCLATILNFENSVKLLTVSDLFSYVDAHRGD